MDSGIKIVTSPAAEEGINWVLVGGAALGLVAVAVVFFMRIQQMKKKK